MAWSTPKTWVLDDDLDAVTLNRYIRDNQNWLRDKVIVDKRNLNRYGNYSTTSGAWVAVDATNLTASCDSNGGDFLVTVMAHGLVDNRTIYVTVELDGVENSHFLQLETQTTDRINLSFTYVFPNVSAGSHSVQLVWKTGGGVVYMYRPQLTVREVL